MSVLVVGWFRRMARQRTGAVCSQGRHCCQGWWRWQRQTRQVCTLVCITKGESRTKKKKRQWWWKMMMMMMMMIVVCCWLEWSETSGGTRKDRHRRCGGARRRCSTSSHRLVNRVGCACIERRGTAFVQTRQLWCAPTAVRLHCRQSRVAQRQIRSFVSSHWNWNQRPVSDVYVCVCLCRCFMFVVSLID